jgi:small subunit ribosomal protein S20
LTKRRPVSRLPAPTDRTDPFPRGDFVANTKSAEKAARQAEKHRARNVALRSRMRTAMRGVTTAIAGGNKEAARSRYQAAVPVIDSLVTKQIVHRNKAARHKILPASHSATARRETPNWSANPACVRPMLVRSVNMV